MLPSAPPPQTACGHQRVRRGTHLWRTWHQLQLKVRSEDMQASQLRCCRQAARQKQRPLSTSPPQAPPKVQLS